MKNKPMFFQISLLFMIMVALIGFVVSTMVPATLRSFFTNEIYQTIEESQDMTNRISRNGMMNGGGQAMRSVQHIFLDHEGAILSGRPVNPDALSMFHEQALSQKEPSKRYEFELEGKTLLYVISNKQISGMPVIQVSLMMDTYRSELISTLLGKLYLILLIALAVGFILSFFFAKWLVKPIYTMKDSLLNYAGRKWDVPLILDRKDELGVLADSIEKMRKQLKEQDEAQQVLLQNISHDLKTPVMVIRSYAEALKEGMYPAGSPEDTGEIIAQEASNLEKKVKDLIYLTKLEYVSQVGQKFSPVNLKPLVIELAERLQPIRPEVKLDLNLTKAVLMGNEEQLKVLLENLIENAYKFARSTIQIRLKENKDSLFLQCFNDGEGIPEEIASKIFDPFVKGENGSFGLGLTIVYQITELHNGEIKARNENDGVSFYLSFPTL